MGGVFLLSLVFYKICTKLIHKLYVGLRFRLVYMECGEPRHNRHTVSLLADRMVVSPNVSQTRKRYVQAPYLSPGFGDFRYGGSAHESIIKFGIKGQIWKFCICLYGCLNTKISLEIFKCQKR